MVAKTGRSWIETDKNWKWKQLTGEDIENDVLIRKISDTTGEKCLAQKDEEDGGTGHKEKGTEAQCTAFQCLGRKHFDFHVLTLSGVLTFSLLYLMWLLLIKITILLANFCPRCTISPWMFFLQLEVLRQNVWLFLTINVPKIYFCQ